MSTKLKISYTINNIDSAALDGDLDYTIFMRTAMVGDVSISAGDSVVKARRCGLLQLSNALIYLCIMPILYQPNDNEVFVTESVDMKSAFVNGQIRISLRAAQDRNPVEFDLDPVEAIAEVGRFQSMLLKSLFKSDDRFRTNSQIREFLTFASVNLLKGKNMGTA
jgi:hypothetical protein